MGHYDTTQLPIYRYLHAPGAPNYVIADHFFQAAFGGSFLNHQYLIAARAPLDTSAGPAAPKRRTASLDTNGIPNTLSAVHARPEAGQRRAAHQACDRGRRPGVACGDYAVNTIQPSNPPLGGGPQLPLIDDTQYPNIGDRLSARRASRGTGTPAAGTTPRPGTPARCSSTTTSRSTTSRTTRRASRAART